MNISRLVAAAPRTAALSLELSKLNGPCVGCTDCNGLCKELIEALIVPDVILSRKHGT
ncbi:hypothetical protein QO034_00970 [Sedimentitalea sp. JM2-8]|jgi:hypothetical protein|uniref:4Fe-4S ferredoxin-type domain-containing protein n=1 Tax=Sedimentitalea xiamensis TaxID=3050037 RepID=A0ABT7F986_9RHOB|nr:hypothetical protein [Sedimentitalea xiamensis]MDK3071668.1 hypothetical protein [Sedimentitalea xiamensis]